MADFNHTNFVIPDPGFFPSEPWEGAGFLVLGDEGDVNSPTVTFVTTPGRLPAKSTPVSFVVADVSPLARVFVSARFPALGISETIYNGAEFVPPYRASERSAENFTVRRDGGWPASFDLEVSAVDTEGNAV